MFRRLAYAACILFAALISSASAQSTDLSYDIPAASSGWEFSMTPYAWLIFITGEQTAGTTTSDINTNLFEIIDEAKELYAFMSDQELRKGRLGIFADVHWAKVRVPTKAAFEGEIPTLPALPSLPIDLQAKGGATVNIVIAEPGVAYEIFNRSSGGSFKDPANFERSTSIDVLAGARYWYLKTEIALNVTATVSLPALGLSRTGGGRVDATNTIDWWDPYVGVRVRQQRGPGRELVLRGDIGGFGVGSDFTWQLEGLYNVDTRLFGYDVTAQLGYRALYADYEQGSGSNTVGFDWLWHGPTLGLKFSW